MWTTRISPAQFKVLLAGQRLEILLEEGVLVIEQDPDQILVIRFLTRDEAGIRF